MATKRALKQSEYISRRREQNHSRLGNSQRVITIARRRRGWRQIDLAERMYRRKEDISSYECGTAAAPWDELERVMPELAEMRVKGCAAYCDTPHICRIAPCKYSHNGRPRKVG